MFSNRIALAAVAVACVTAAAGGSYLATRHNLAAVASPDAAAASPEATPLQPVQETEALVSAPVMPETAAPVASSAPVTAAVPARVQAKRVEAPARPTPRRQETRTAAARPAPQPPALDRSWPSASSSTTISSTPTTLPDSQSSAQHVEDRPADVALTPEPAAKNFEELVVAADSVIGLQTETALSSERSRVEDRVEARVVRDVKVGSTVAIPAGSRAIGSVISVERGGKFKDRARLGIRFETLVLADGSRLPITTDTIYRNGDAPANGTAARVGGGAVVGAIIGGIIGGGKGAAIGAGTGAGAGTASVMAGDRSVATLPAGAEVTARIMAPVTVTVEK